MSAALIPEMSGKKAIVPDWLIEICLILVVVTMPYENIVNSYFIDGFGIVWLFSNRFGKKIQNLRRDPFFWILSLAYLACIVSAFFWDKSNEKSVIQLEEYTAFLALPIFFGSLDKLDGKVLKRVLLAFVITNIAASFYCLFSAYLEYKSTQYINVFFYHHLSKHIGISAVYYSMYCVFSIVILLYYYLINEISPKKRAWSFLAFLYLIFFVIMLASKMFIFLLFLTGACLVVYSYIFLHRTRLGIIFIIVFLVAMPILLVKFPYAMARIEYTQLKKYGGQTDNNNGLAVRYILWKSTWKLIKNDQTLFGIGHFSAQDALSVQYRLAGFEEAAQNDYNSHNQYLFTWLCYGYLGLLTLSAFLIYVFWRSWCQRNFLAIALCLLFILGNFTECMFETEKGIVFFLFFSSLLVFHAPRFQGPVKAV